MHLALLHSRFVVSLLCAQKYNQSIQSPCSVYDNVKESERLEKCSGFKKMNRDTQYQFKVFNIFIKR